MSIGLWVCTRIRIASHLRMCFIQVPRSLHTLTYRHYFSLYWSSVSRRCWSDEFIMESGNYYSKHVWAVLQSWARSLRIFSLLDIFWKFSYQRFRGECSSDLVSWWWWVPFFFFTYNFRTFATEMCLSVELVHFPHINGGQIPRSESCQSCLDSWKISGEAQGKPVGCGMLKLLTDLG